MNCPSCQAAFTLDDDLRGKKIRCKKCEEVFAVQPGKRGADPDEEDSPRSDRRVADKPVPKSPARAPRDEEDERPARKPARPRDEDDEAPDRRPPSRLRSSRDEDDAPRRKPLRGRDDDDRPIRKRKPEKEGMSTGLLVAIGGGGLLLVALLVGGVMVAVFSGRSSTPAPPNAPPFAGQQFAANPNPGGNPPPKQEEPKALPGDLGPDALQRVKESTVYLRVDMPSGGAAEGTGFFAVEPGVIITNAHVLGMLTPDSLPPKSVTVKVHHGEPKEIQLKGTVLGVDRANDLAVLRTDANPASLPPPLKVETTAGLTETQKVWIFGFPLGVRLGKNITVSPSSVTSLRKDPTGAISQVQVSGGMQPGNSGGPVTNSRGNVVGVSVSIIQGTQLAFAIPGEFVTRVLAGGISEQEFGTAFAAGAGRNAIPVRLTALDPLQRIRKVEVDLWTGAADESFPASDKEPPARPGDGPRTRVPATLKGAIFTADVPLPPLPAGQFYWSQPVFVNEAGVAKWAASKAVPFDPAVVIERKPATLRFKAPTGPVQHTLHMASTATYNVFGGEQAGVFLEKMDGYALEVASPDTRGLGTGVRLYLGRPQFTREAAGKVEEAPEALGEFVTQFQPSYLVLGDNSVKEFGRPTSFVSVPETHRKQVTKFFEAVCNTWEVTSVPLPNRSVRPQDTWPGKIPMFVTIGPKKELLTLDVTCTYEGTRSLDGVERGYILLAGVVRGVGKNIGDIYGKVSGHAHVDLATGVFSQVKTTISFEIETGNAGLRILVNDENVVDRVDGNTQDIRIPEVVVAPKGWKQYFSKDRSFTVMMPDAAAPVKDGSQVILPRKGSPLSLSFTKVMGQGKGPPVYVASSVAVNRVDLIGKATPAERIDWFRDGERGKAKLSGEKSISQGRVPGKEFLVERAANISRYRVYMHLDKFYVAVVTGTREQVESEDATTFLDSYTIPAAFTGPVPKKERPKGPPKGKGGAAK
jgi:predicted Zn finger-like uncharacterized protein